jgi:hypothetical protein
MGAGGIINDRVRALLKAANDPSVYPYLSDEDKDSVEAINQKGPFQCTSGDMNTLLTILGRICCP